MRKRHLSLRKICVGAFRVGHYSPKGGITGPLGGALQGELQVGLGAERVTGPDLEALGEVRRVSEGRDHLAGHLLWFAAGRVQGEVRLVHVQGDRLDHGRQTMDNGGIGFDWR